MEEEGEEGGRESEWFASLKCLFGFDNVAQPWQVFRLSVAPLPPPLAPLLCRPSPPALYNLEYQGRALLYPGYSSFTGPNQLQARLRAQVRRLRVSFSRGHFATETRLALALRLRGEI